MDDPLLPPNSPQEAPPPPADRALPFATLLYPADEQKFVDDAVKRIDDLKSEMGWTPGDNAHPDSKTWFGIREIAQKKWDGKLEFRAVPNRDGTESIFQFSNVSLNTVRHQARDLVASVINNTCGTKPFFTTMPVGDLPDDPDPTTTGTPDPSAPGSSPQTALAGPVPMAASAAPGPSPVKLAKLIGMFADDKIDASNCEDSLRQGLQMTPIKGEQVYKVAHQFEQTHTRGQETVLCGPDGTVLYTADSDVIHQEDEDKAAPLGAPRIPKDPHFIVPDGAVFMLKTFDRMNTTKRGPDVSCVDGRSFLCPLNVDDIHKGANVFLYDLAVEEVARLYRHPGFVKANKRQPTSDEARAILADLETETSAPKTPVSKPDPDHREGEPNSNDENRRVMQIAEFYDCLDVDGDGFAEEFVLVLHLKPGGGATALYYNYLDQVFLSGRRPFEVTTFGRVANRWYGTGLFEQFERQELFIDTQLNRENWRNSAAGRMDFWQPDATREGKAGEPPAFGTGVPYELNPGKTAKDAFDFVTPPEMTDGIKELRQEMIQAVQVEGGNIGAADGAQSGLNSSKTAYGIRNIEQNKDSLQGFYEDEMQKGVLDVVQAAVDCVFFHMDDLEEFSYTEKDKAIFRTITREQVRGLKYKVSLSLLQKQTQQNLQNLQLAIQLSDAYLTKSPETQKVQRAVFIQVAKILKIQEAETQFPDPDTIPRPPAPGPTPEQTAALWTALASVLKATPQLAAQVTVNDLIAMLQGAGLPAPSGPPPAQSPSISAPGLPPAPTIAPDAAQSPPTPTGSTVPQP